MCLICKQIEIGTKAAGEKGRNTEKENFITQTKARFMKDFGWMEMQSVELCVILEGRKQQRWQSIQFHRWNFWNCGLKVICQ